MVKSGGFVVGISDVLGLPEPTIAGAFRILREIGLMTSGARGVHAPDMTDMDAARMLIAMLVSERPAYAESSVRDFGQLICSDFQSASERLEGLNTEVREEFIRLSSGFTLDARGLAERHTFESAVAELIRMCADDREKEYWISSQVNIEHRGKFDPNIIIKVTPGELSAEINMQGNVYFYGDPLFNPDTWGQDDSFAAIQADLDIEDAHQIKRSRYSTKINSIRSVNTVQLVALATMLRAPSSQ